MPEEQQAATRSTRGFASMDLEKRRAIARKGGESVPNEKRSFSQNHELASQAGRKGGQSVDPEKRSFLPEPSPRRTGGPEGRPRLARWDPDPEGRPLNRLGRA